MRPRHAWPLTALLAIFPASAPAADWVEYTSENFTVYSDAPENRVIGALEEVEELRRLVHSTLGISDAIAIERIRVVVIDSLPEYGRLATGYSRGRFLIGGMKGSLFVLPFQTTEDMRRGIAWGYTSLLMWHYSAFTYPEWYRSGLRELLSNADFGASGIVLGVPPNVTWIPASVSEVIRGEYDGQGVFLTSWLLAHHFAIESIGDANRQQQAADYLSRFDAGEDPETAFRESFGMSPRDFQSELEFDARTARLSTLDIPRAEYTGTMLLRTLEQDEAAYTLGGVALALNSNERAIEYFDSLDGGDNDSRFAEKIGSKKAIALVHDGRVEEGDSQFDDLLTRVIVDAEVLADLCHYSFDRYVIEAGNAGTARTDFLTLAIEYGERAVALDGRSLDALLDLGRAYEANDELDRASETLLRAYEIEPSSSFLGLTLARVLIKSGQLDMAIQTLSGVYRASGSGEERDQILEVQRSMAEPDFDVASFAVLNQNRR